MSERAPLAEKVRAARTLVQPAWDDARALHLAERTLARRRRRAIARGVALSSALIATVSVLAWLGHAPAPAVDAPVVAQTDEAASGVLRLHDGSIVTPLDAETEIYVEAMREDAIELVLVRGVARFEVVPGLPRAFRVRSGRVTVSVVGTVFTVRRSGVGAEVSVDEGRVRVEWDPDGRATLGAGEHGTYPVAIEAASSDAVDPSASTVGREPPTAVVPEPDRDGDEARVETVASIEPPPEPPPRRARDRARTSEAREPEPEPEVASGWRALAEQGRFDEGYSLLLVDPSVLPSRDVESLMQAADCARLSGHPAESLAYLRRALEVGEGDPRAPMAAFTLGRVLLQQLRRPRDAAEAFARARALAPEGSLASDALAREVEAWHFAGDQARARVRALEYLRLYPQGLRAAAVRQHGGLE